VEISPGVELTVLSERIRSTGLVLLRLGTASWVGAGVMFLAILLGLRGSPLFDAATKDQHPRVLFPRYYTLEFVCLGIGLLGALLAQPRPTAPAEPVPVRKRRFPGPAVWLGLAMGAALMDYFVLYRPLAEMLGRPPYPDSFRRLHEWSRWVNSGILLWTLLASLQSLWPSRDR
jgi:hypothetical protein